MLMVPSLKMASLMMLGEGSVFERVCEQVGDELRAMGNKVKATRAVARSDLIAKEVLLRYDAG